MALPSSRVPLIVLAHLGLLPFIACKEDDTHTVEPVSSASVSASSTATSPPTPTVTATATVTTTATAPEHHGMACNADIDCAAYAQCKHLATADGGGGECVYREHYNLGRPLVADGVAHVAPYVKRISVSSAEGAALAIAAREEHASIAAFARTIAELMALGAPTWLLYETQEALADEIRHTDLSLAMLWRVTGERFELDALPAATLPLRHGDDTARELFRDVFRGGAVGETLAAADAERRRTEASEPESRAFYETLFRDESKHAALAFKTLRWLLSTRPELRVTCAEERARFAQEGSLEARALVSPLLHTLD